jgi:hypothetical protein
VNRLNKPSAPRALQSSRKSDIVSFPKCHSAHHGGSTGHYTGPFGRRTKIGRPATPNTDTGRCPCKAFRLCLVPDAWQSRPREIDPKVDIKAPPYGLGNIYLRRGLLSKEKLAGLGHRLPHFRLICRISDGERCCTCTTYCQPTGDDPRTIGRKLTFIYGLL